VVDFLQAAHEADERYSVRDGINIARYALKRLHLNGGENAASDRGERIKGLMKEAAVMILDPTAAQFFEEIIEDS